MRGRPASEADRTVAAQYIEWLRRNEIDVTPKPDEVGEGKSQSGAGPAAP